MVVIDPGLAWHVVLRLAGPSSVASSSVLLSTLHPSKELLSRPRKANEGTGRATTSTQAPVDLRVQGFLALYRYTLDAVTSSSSRLFYSGPTLVEVTLALCALCRPDSWNPQRCYFAQRLQLQAPGDNGELQTLHPCLPFHRFLCAHTDFRQRNLFLVML